MQKAKRVVRYVVWSAAVMVLAVCLGTLHLLATDLDRIGRDFQLDAAPEASLVYDRHNTLLFSFASEDRTTVPIERVSTAMIEAVLTSEDRSFFRHAGMDMLGVARAAWMNLKARAIKQGGSTITQQMVRHIALTADRTIERKIREALLALRVERRFAKEAILEAYLNRIYLGNGHYGVEAAARGYFGKSAADLSAGESALLAGLIPCPSMCSPRTAPALARSRRDAVLRAMRERGTLARAEYEQAVASPLALAAERHDPYTMTHAGIEAHETDGAVGLHFLEAVRRQVMEQFGANKVLEGGLRIYTTIDMRLQRHAEEAIRVRLSHLDATGRLEGALVALDPRTGEVLALVGGRDFHRSSFNRATQARRQPGSAFKPLFFAAALEQGYTPSSIVQDINTGSAMADGAWLPPEGGANAVHDGEEPPNVSYTVRQALVVSSNRASVRLMQMVGLSTAQSYARRLGITSPLPSVPSLALGTGEVTLLDLTSAYGAFANAGIVAPHTLMTRIEDRHGNILWQHSLDRHPYRAIRPGTAFLMSTMMADVIDRGTASGARAAGFRLPAAGKTGTTDDYGDAWFVGYTPSLAAGVWIGHDERKPIMRRGYAGTVAVPAWARFMAKATVGAKSERFTMPPDVERVAICRASGQRASTGCRLSAGDNRGVYEEMFLLGTGPYDTCHGVHTDPADAGAAPGVTKAPFAVF
jgi:1A family penicillin-binding protein